MQSLEVISVNIWPVSYTHLDVYKRQVPNYKKMGLYCITGEPAQRSSCCRQLLLNGTDGSGGSEQGRKECEEYDETVAVRQNAAFVCGCFRRHPGSLL